MNRTKTYPLIVVSFLLLSFFSGLTVRAQENLDYLGMYTNYPFLRTTERARVYDYPTGHFIAEAIGLNSENGILRGYRAPDQDFTIDMCIKNSDALSVGIDDQNNALYIEVEGPSGTRGSIDLFNLPERFTENVRVYLDSQPVEFTTENSFHIRLADEDNYNIWEFTVPSTVIHVEYVHGKHVVATVGAGGELTTTGGAEGEVPQAWYSQPLNLALLALAVVAAIGAIYRFR